MVCVVGVIVAFMEMFVPWLRTEPGEILKAPSSSLAPPTTGGAMGGGALSTKSLTTLAQPVVNNINTKNRAVKRIDSYRQDRRFLKLKASFSQYETVLLC